MLLVAPQVVDLKMPVQPLRDELLQDLTEDGEKGNGAKVLHLCLLAAVLVQGHYFRELPDPGEDAVVQGQVDDIGEGRQDGGQHLLEGICVDIVVTRGAAVF